MSSPALPRVVIIGAGFGGLVAARALCRSSQVSVTLVDRTNHHLFQPLLYQVAAAGLTAPAMSAPIRHILRREMQQGRLTVLRAEVCDMHMADHHLTLDDGQGLAFDNLIVAAGATHSYFGHDDWAANAPGLKTLADAFDIRARIINAFEQAERCSAAAEREAWLNFVIIGAGPTGVELAGALAEIARHTLRHEFRHIDTRQARIVLMEGGARALGAFDARLSQRAAQQLHSLGVDLRSGCQVVNIHAQGVEFSQGGGPAQAMRARTVLWAAGVAASPLGAVLARECGATLDRAGRVQVLPDLSLPGHPEVQVIGDLAALSTPTPQGPRPVPGVSPAAKQMGHLAAANLLRRLRQQDTQSFRYADYGTLATIGRHAAVVQLELPGGRQLSFAGFAAWLFWLFAHVYFLIGFRNRLVVMLDWAISYFSFARHARVVAQSPTLSAAPPHPASPGAANTQEP